MQINSWAESTHGLHRHGTEIWLISAWCGCRGMTNLSSCLNKAFHRTEWTHGTALPVERASYRCARLQCFNAQHVRLTEGEGQESMQFIDRKQNRLLTSLLEQISAIDFVPHILNRRCSQYQLCLFLFFFLRRRSFYFRQLEWHIWEKV